MQIIDGCTFERGALVPPCALPVKEGPLVEKLKLKLPADVAMLLPELKSANVEAPEFAKFLIGIGTEPEILPFEPDGV